MTEIDKERWPHTVYDAFAGSVDRFPDRIAVRNTKLQPGEGEAVTYSELGRMAESLASGFAARGISKGDRVAIHAGPSIHYAAIFLASLRLGAWVVPLDPRLRESELRPLLEEAKPRAAFTARAVADGIRDIVQWVVELDSAGERGFAAILDGGGAPVRDQRISPDETAVVAFTSGTTGQAKGVILSHRNLVADAFLSSTVIPITEQDVFLSIAPWHHLLGLTSSLVVPLIRGAQTMYTNDHRRLAPLLKAHGVSIFIGVPKVYHALYARMVGQARQTVVGRMLFRVAPRAVGRTIRNKLTAGNLRFFVSGSAPLDGEVSSGFRRLGLGLLEGYGLTETSPIVCFCDPFTKKTGAVGRPLPGVEAKLIDANTEGIGELCLRGPIVMQGYLDNEQATAAMIDADGWLHTGDLAALDADGEIYLKGRAKNVIVLENGKNVYPEEIEWEMASVRYVEEIMVRGRVVNGREAVEALVYPNPDQLAEDGISGAEEIRAAVWSAIRARQSRLSPHKRLHGRDRLVIVEQPFPKTSTLDIKRHVPLAAETNRSGDGDNEAGQARCGAMLRQGR
ncbi:AMP-binding protein [Candidatus Bipolaricaulota bacterium]|nr:AMP-binding protein [Candidatus Bipolaricaulota bacterium]